MNYRVIWRQRTLRNLHVFGFRLLHEGWDTDELDLAVAEINSRLGRDPANEGESRADPERVFIFHPLSVKYEVFEEAGVVLIYEMILYPRMRG